MSRVVWRGWPAKLNQLAAAPKSTDREPQDPWAPHDRTPGFDSDRYYTRDRPSENPPAEVARRQASMEDVSDLGEHPGKSAVLLELEVRT